MNALRIPSYSVLVISLVTTVAWTMESSAQELPPAATPALEGTWSVAFGFGEIPFLAGSFKPSVSFGYHINRFIYVGTIVQLPDVIERGDESFNAVNAGVDGLLDTRETTGPRAFLGTRLRPHRYSPYLSLGAVFNGSDVETMYFDARPRELAGETHPGPFEVELTRPFGIRPAFGLGYSLTLDNGLAFELEFTGAWLFDAAEPDVRVRGESLSPGAREDLQARFLRSYDDNFHNRYHLFNIAIGYAW